MGLAVFAVVLILFGLFTKTFRNRRTGEPYKQQLITRGLHSGIGLALLLLWYAGLSFTTVFVKVNVKTVFFWMAIALLLILWRQDPWRPLTKRMKRSWARLWRTTKRSR